MLMLSHTSLLSAPRTSLNWGRKKNKALGNLASFQTLLVLSLNSLHSQGTSETGQSSAVPLCGAASLLFATLSVLFNNLAISTAIREVASSLSGPLAAFFEQTGRWAASVQWTCLWASSITLLEYVFNHFLFVGLRKNSKISSRVSLQR